MWIEKSSFFFFKSISTTRLRAYTVLTVGLCCTSHTWINKATAIFCHCMPKIQKFRKPQKTFLLILFHIISTSTNPEVLLGPHVYLMVYCTVEYMVRWPKSAQRWLAWQLLHQSALLRAYHNVQESEMSIGLDLDQTGSWLWRILLNLDWSRTVKCCTNFGPGQDLDWVNGQELRNFCH